MGTLISSTILRTTPNTLSANFFIPASSTVAVSTLILLKKEMED